MRMKTFLYKKIQSLHIKEDSTEEKEQKKAPVGNKQQNDRSKFLLISNVYELNSPNKRKKLAE